MIPLFSLTTPLSLWRGVGGEAKIILSFLLLLAAVCARADNVVSIGSAEGVPGATVEVSVSLTNTDAVASMQLQLPMPEGVSVAGDGNVVLGSRAVNHQATVGVKDGMLNIIVYSIQMTALDGTEGEVLRFSVLLGNQPQATSLQPTVIRLTDPDGNTLNATAQGGTLTTRTAKADYGSRAINFGHVPIYGTYHQSIPVHNTGNAPLVITELTMDGEAVPTLGSVGSYRRRDACAPSGNEAPFAIFSTTTAFPLTVAAGGTASIDVTYCPIERGTIKTDVRVVSNSISRLNTIVIDADPFAVNELHVGSAMGVSDTEVTIPLTVNNMDALSGFQIEFDLPSQLQYVSGSAVLSDRKDDHTLLATERDGRLVLIAYSTAGKTFSGDDGVIASFRVALKGRYSTALAATKAVLTATYKGQDLDVLSAKYQGQVTIQSPRLNAASSLAMGDTPVTADAEQTLRIRNQGNAPLTVSRVVFSNDHLTLTEALPLTIGNYGYQDVHVVYDSKEEVPFTGTMTVYSNDPDQRVWTVSVSGSRFAPNYLSFAAPDIYSGDSLKVEMAVDNYDAVNGLQFDVTYPSDYFEPTNDLQLTARAAGLNVQWRAIDKQTARYFFYSLTDAEIASGSGNVLTFGLAPKGDIPEGSYTLYIKEVKLGTATLTDKYAGKDLTCTFNVATVVRGDANADKTVNIADITAVINYLNSRQEGKFSDRNADTNGDSIINIADVTGIINLLNKQ